MRKGTVRVWLNIPDFPDEPFVGVVSATANAGLSSIFNNDIGQNTTWAVDCVEVVTGTEGTGRLRPQLVAAVAVAGGGGTAGLSRMNYQANVLLQLPDPELVSLGLSDLAGFPLEFGPVATVFAGQGWQGLITLSDVPLSPGVLVQLSIPPGDQQWVALPNPPSHQIPVSNEFTIFTAPRTTVFTAAEHSEIDVPVTATLAGTSRTATLRILGTPG